MADLIASVTGVAITDLYEIEKSIYHVPTDGLFFSEDTSSGS